MRLPRTSNPELLVLLTILVGLLPVPGPVRAGQAGRLPVGLPGPVRTLDSQRAASDPASLAPIVNIQEGLFELDSSGRIQRVLAESWVYQPHRNRLQIRLRQNVLFHNGDLLTPADVVFTVRRLLDPQEELPTREIFRALAGAEAGEQEVTLKLTEPIPESRLLRLLTRPELLVLSNRAVREQGGNYGRAAAVGTGPFRLEEWIRGRKLTLVRHGQYWRTRGEPSGESEPEATPEPAHRLPRLDQVEFIPYAGVEAMVDAVWRGAVRLGVEPSPENAPERLIRLPRKIRPGRRLVQVYLNLEIEPWQDRRVRRALSLATDRASLVDRVYRGLADPAPGPIPPSSRDHDPEILVDPYDPDQARELLRQAGYGPESPLGFPLLVTDEPGLRAVAEHVVSQWALVGVDAQPVFLAKQRLFDLIYQRTAPEEKLEFSAALEDWQDFRGGDDSWQYLRHFGSDSPENKCRYRNRRLDRDLATYQEMGNPGVQQELARRIETRLAEDRPCVFLLFPQRIWPHSRRLKGFQPGGHGGVRLGEVELEL